ncbi:MAG: hypothetical protein P9L92_01900 [Candidatus Electryonea clarkiae]|nr:hypothetical protein [Candidatus Electryonea clarkiae]MDP8285143.1 hypothetical protein [Candidatus Electryonea clarkiae]
MSKTRKNIIAHALMVAFLFASYQQCHAWGDVLYTEGMMVDLITAYGNHIEGLPFYETQDDSRNSNFLCAALQYGWIDIAMNTADYLYLNVPPEEDLGEITYAYDEDGLDEETIEYHHDITGTIYFPYSIPDPEDFLKWMFFNGNNYAVGNDGSSRGSCTITRVFQTVQAQLRLDDGEDWNEDINWTDDSYRTVYSWEGPDFWDCHSTNFNYNHVDSQIPSWLGDGVIVTIHYLELDDGYFYLSNPKSFALYTLTDGTIRVAGQLDANDYYPGGPYLTLQNIWPRTGHGANSEGDPGRAYFFRTNENCAFTPLNQAKSLINK